MTQVSSPTSAGRALALPDAPGAGLPPAARYAVGLVGVVVTLLLQLAVEPFIQQETPFLLFFAPILLTAWTAGLRPAIAATLLAAVLANYFFLGARGAFILDDTGVWLALAVFIAEGALFSALVAALHQARQRAEAARHQAEAGQERMAFLADVSTALSGSTDVARALPAVAARAVPTLADWCALAVRFDEGGPQRFAAGAPPPSPDGAAPAPAAALEAHMDALLADDAPAPDSAPGRAALVLPIAVREGRVGALALARHAGGFGPDDLALAEEVARRVANAIEAVLLFRASQQLNVELERRVQERTREVEAALNELRAANARLELSNRELEQFAYVASHDLQEPLRKIQAFGDRLKIKAAPQLSDDARDYLARMQSAAGRMQTLINDLLAFSRVTSKAQPFVPVDLGQVAREVVADLEARIEQTGGRVELGLLPTVMADPLQMRQLFQNLLGNALKFHRAGVPPVVRVSGEVTAALPPATQAVLTPEPYCRIAVADNGIGFDPKYGDRIFNVFQRLHGRGQYEGSGVGLAICRKIVERHAGTIAADSVPGEGTTFIVMLPIRQGQPALPERAAPPDPAQVAPGGQP